MSILLVHCLNFKRMRLIGTWAKIFIFMKEAVSTSLACHVFQNVGD